MPLLLYSISIVRRKSAQQKVAFELAHKDLFARKFTIQTTMLLLLPLIPPVLTYQKVHRRVQRGLWAAS